MKRIFTLFSIALLLLSFNFVSANQEPLRKDLLESIVSILSEGRAELFFSALKISKEDIEKFKIVELVENNLPESITFWTSAYCPEAGTPYDYKVPEGYESIECDYGETGSHGGCSFCSMSRIKLSKIKEVDIAKKIISQEDVEKFKVVELVENNLPESITFWTSAYCPEAKTIWDYKIPEGYKKVSCSYGRTGSHGGCSFCTMTKITLIEDFDFKNKQESRPQIQIIGSVTLSKPLKELSKEELIDILKAVLEALGEK